MTVLSSLLSGSKTAGAPTVRPPNPNYDAMMRATAPHLAPYAGPPINCAAEANRIPPPLPWWLPPGTMRANMGWFYVYWNVRQLGDLKTPLSQFIPENQVSQQAYDDIFKAWHDGSKDKFNGYAARGTALGNNPNIPVPANFPARPALTLSLDAFMKAYPQFVLAYRDVTAPTPTRDETTGTNGVRKFKSRGGYLIYAPYVDGREALKRVNYYACAQWARGCVTPSWPSGVPTCLNQIKIETENFDWGLFIARATSGYNVTTSRLPKRTWDHIEDGLSYLTGPLARFQDWLCANYNQPTAQAVQATASAYGGPYVTGAMVAGNTILKSGCRISSQPGVTTNYVPGSTVPTSTGGKDPRAAVYIAPVQLTVAFPAGSITWYDSKALGYRIAVPVTPGIGTAMVAYRELPSVQLIAPVGPIVVSKQDWQKATRPWFKRDSTKLGVAVISGLAAVGVTGLYLRGHHG